METGNAKQVLSNLYGLLMEINLHMEDEDILDELKNKPDAQIEKHLMNIRRLTTKYKAYANKLQFQRALDKLRQLSEIGIEEVKQFFNSEEQAQLVKLFRKFDESSPECEADLLEDDQFLSCMNILKTKLNEPEK